VATLLSSSDRRSDGAHSLSARGTETLAPSLVRRMNLAPVRVEHAQGEAHRNSIAVEVRAA
jgi:hypothetical protein